MWSVKDGNEISHYSSESESEAEAESKKIIKSIFHSSNHSIYVQFLETFFGIAELFFKVK